MISLPVVWALGLLGLAAGLLRLGWRGSFGLAARRLSVTVTIDNRVAEFRQLLDWLDHAGALGRARRFRLTWTGGRNARKASFAPALGTHWFVLDGQLVQLHREMSDKARHRQRHTVGNVDSDPAPRSPASRRALD